MTNLEITNAYVGDTQVEKIYLGTDVVWEKVEEPEVQLFYNGQLVTGASHGGITRIYLNSTDTSVTFDVRTKNQSTPWAIIDYYFPIAHAQGTGSTSNVSMEVHPDSQDFMGFPKIMKYKQEGDQDGDDAEAKWTGWTGEACWFGFRLNNA